MGEPLSSKETLALQIIAHSSSMLSILGSIFIILSYLLFRNIRKAHAPLIFWLSVCDFFSSLAYFAIPVAKGSIYCSVQGGMIQFFQIGSFTWTASIALALYLVMVKNKTFNVGIGHLMKYLHLFAWSFAAIDVGIGVYLNVYGDANYEGEGSPPSWCWIKSDRNLEKFVLYFLPFGVVWIFNLIIYVMVSRTINKVVKSQELRGRAFTRMRLYLLVYMFCIGIGAVNRIQNFISPKNPIFWLNVCDAAVSPLQGFLNSVVYGMNKQIRKAWIHGLCCKGKEAEKEPILTPNTSYDSTPYVISNDTSVN